jgi:hypothetical protein
VGGKTKTQDACPQTEEEKRSESKVKDEREGVTRTDPNDNESEDGKQNND